MKIVNYPTASPASTTTYELTSVTGAAPPASGSLDGTYETTAIRRNGTAAPSPIADLITGANSMSFLVAGSVGNITWSDATCSIVQPVGLLRVGGEECATLASSTDPISYVLTKQ